ncbi:Protein kinase, ATP binding site-containing protein [Artemisia annua]|uniref:cyclin-dependent kinase n=1 Tax=Artemisia annua TaxID=35608 RepID=A0A2U1P123_ARTAN|nr:Protein kinase, ATP binding site-containing protein [Artemisia annua]
MVKERIPPTALREISLLPMLSDSIYIVRLICVQQIYHNGKPLLYLVFEYLDTDLKNFIDMHRVAHCHGHDVLHRDLKPQDLLADKDKGILKSVDIGLGCTFTVPLK